MQKKSIIFAENLACQIDLEKNLFASINLSISEHQQIGLVGANGVGKSTLLKIIAGQISPSAGSIYRNGLVSYLPQVSTLRKEIKDENLLNFLSSVSEEWWQIEEILQNQFNTVLDLSLSISNLSGGELSKLFLAIALSQQPDLLLLDEPTNHMDLLALESLRLFLNNFSGAFVIVSHKPLFLDQVVDNIWELTPEGIKFYGGNFSQYRQQKEIEFAAAVRIHEVARKELKCVQESAMKEQQRAAESQRKGRANLLNGSIDRMSAGLSKSQAESSAGIAKKRHEAAIVKASQKAIDTKIKTKKTMSLELSEKNQKHRHLIDIQGGNLWVAERLLLKDIQLHIQSGDRIVISGANGSGKSSLAQAILGTDLGINSEIHKPQLNIDFGEMIIAPRIKMVYLDQSYEIINRNLNILENMQIANPNLNYQQIRQQLGHFLFKYDDVYKPTSVLSGGELARLAIAIISVSAIDLLILDEPTNNLDIETVNQMVEGINEYQGALWVISHDLDFLSRIHITKSFQIYQQILKSTTYLPTQIQEYYQELLDINC
ncbi:ribosomal protection-like ABC-F family protein [Calothrix sp. UHCC 0171]|uniref:ribosomal protection-like ABC-F family protein n=1 Tax=Calothrix sp. UHCC 0171 TaxID=3110245 RepID=UPI002B203ACB|nr:ABC-F family ATP-binding cassette domain-containing protein [Calothrix sp. UHCC 0171]MEA5573300.1 ABC-F family ATP-binding cassette domain-containing protein [Calothrix sp. UHCC 0171]